MSALVIYKPWERRLFCDRPETGSRWYYGNFGFGLAIDNHPRFFTFKIKLLLFEFGYSAQRKVDIIQAADGR